MTGYPPKCTQNGNRHLPFESYIQCHEQDVWPGDTVENADGSISQLDRDGETWLTIKAAPTYSNVSE